MHVADLSSPLCVFPAHISNQYVTLVLREKMLPRRGDSFNIQTISDRVLFRVKREYLSISSRKHFMDAKGELLFDIRKRRFTFRTIFYGETPSGNVVFELNRKPRSKIMQSYTLHLSWAEK